MPEHARPHVDHRLPYLSPWLRAALLIRQICSATWDLATWPTMKQALKAALLTRSYSVMWDRSGSGPISIDTRLTHGCGDAPVNGSRRPPLPTTLAFAQLPPHAPELALPDRCSLVVKIEPIV